MACGDPRRVRGMTAGACVLSILAACVVAQPEAPKAGQLRVLTDGDWQEVLTGEWMIEFFAPWCPACQQLEPVWTEFAGWGDDLGVNIAKVDVTEHPGLSGRFIIMALPTIYHCKDGVFRRYQGDRSKEDFLSFIEEKKWQSIEPVSSWFGPSSFLMNIMSALFKLSVFIRHCHNYLTEQMGFSVWESYGIFACATIVAGLFLGLVMVFVADFVFPSRRFSPDYHHRKLPARQVCCQHQFEYEQEADGEEEDDEYEYGGALDTLPRMDATDAHRRRPVHLREEDTQRIGEDLHLAHCAQNHHKNQITAATLIELEDVTHDVIAPSERLMWLCFTLHLAAGLCVFFFHFQILHSFAMQYCGFV